jgi:hypothetical protein
MIGEDSLQKLRRLMELRQRRDESKKQAEIDEKAYREAEADVYEALDEGPMDRLNNIDLGEPWGKVSFQARETIYGRVIDADEAQEYFEQRQMVEEVSEPKFVMARVNELVRDAVEQGEKLPPGLDFYQRRFVSITKQKS